MRPARSAYDRSDAWSRLAQNFLAEPRTLLPFTFGGTRPDEPLPNKGTKAVGIERNCIFQVGHAVGQANMLWIGADRDKHRVPLPSHRLQNPSLSSRAVGQISRPLEVEKASIQLQDADRGEDKIFRPFRDK